MLPKKTVLFFILQSGIQIVVAEKKQKSTSLLLNNSSVGNVEDNDNNIDSRFINQNYDNSKVENIYSINNEFNKEVNLSQVMTGLYNLGKDQQ